MYHRINRVKDFTDLLVLKIFLEEIQVISLKMLKSYKTCSKYYSNNFCFQRILLFL